jgi:flagellar protein FlgJ
MLAEPLALNPQGLDKLRFQASQNNGRESLRAAAQQFEAYFLQLMLRSMRQTLAQDGPFDSRETRMFSDMFDQQVAQSISKNKGVGLADLLEQQLRAGQAAVDDIIPAPRPYVLPLLSPKALAPQSMRLTAGGQNDTEAIVEPMSTPATRPEAAIQMLTPRNFVDRLWPHAVDAAAELGVSPHFLLAQAALESGWGKHELRAADGSNTYNLFNIKAGKSWQGESVMVNADEYLNGKMESQAARFRVYASYTEAFADYARLLKSSPRYAAAVNQGADAAAFARGLQNGGYATDPMYADKILRVLNSSTFRNALAGAGAATQG